MLDTIRPSGKSREHYLHNSSQGIVVEAAGLLPRNHEGLAGYRASLVMSMLLQQSKTGYFSTTHRCRCLVCAK